MSRRNPFKKKEEEQTDLQKMARGLPEFKNFPTVNNRPDQEIQNVDTDRQSKMFAQKVANASAFKDMNIKMDIESKVRGATKPLKPEYIKANVNAAKERFNYDMSPDEVTSRGLVAQGSAVKRPMGMVQNEGGIPTARRREHEAIHFMMDDLAKKYGHGIASYAQEKMNKLIHPAVVDHLAGYLSQVGYGKSAHRLELVPHLYEMLNDPKTREWMRHTSPNFKQNEKETMGQAKKSWNAILDFAANLRAGDEG